ncbi:PhzF family phenazine biosynthesis protein [Segetibacter koreensis]|uniref:PhzF family phenazine biosynthesis protein n=1 Tax=Segetibacter koreensis TaxID=398037 RepID=UPI000372CD15|nr:PhzF family phenazine biosynthesis protein [Segetibacter koreensis]
MSTPFTIFQVDAFTSKLFGGNPAAVCPLETWLPDEIMQKLAAENNLSETAFFVKEGEGYHLRWFTPEFEIDLCGHATLATAFVLFNYLDYRGEVIKFRTKSGVLEVRKKGDLIELNFPTRMPQPCEVPEALLKGINIKPAKVLKSRDYFLVYEDEASIKQIIPDFKFLNQLDVVGVIVTAASDEVDFVSRFFVPNSVIGEDPVTGSAHCNLIPYWSKELNKTILTAKQLSAREGELFCEDKGERVTMAGYAKLYLKGEYYL